ncbi:PAS domain S-box protein [Chloroflexota bacterium]
MEADKNRSLRQKKFLEETRELTDSLQQTNKLLAEAGKRLSREVAKRKQAEELYRILAESSPVGVYIVQDNKFQFVNPQFQKYNGFSERELLKMDPLKLVHPEDLDSVRKNAVQMLKGNKTTPYEIRVITKDGTIKWAMETVSSINYEGKRAALGNFMDITERKEAEEELALRAQLLDNASDAIILHTPDADIVYVNEQYCKLYGYNREDIIGTNIRQMGNFLSDETIKSITSSMEEKGLAVFEITHTRKDGSTFNVEVHARTINSGGSNLVLSVERDITERKQAEEALAKEATRRRILIEGSRDGIVVLDQDGNVYECNKQFAEMLGYSPEEVSQLKVFDWEFLFPQEQVVEMIRSVDEAGDHFETQHRRKDGTIFDVEISTNAAVCAGQKLIFCVCRDITERKQAEQKIEELYGQEKVLRQSLEEEMEWRVDFTRALVHELKTPLTPILAAGELLFDEVQEAPLLKLIESIRRSASTMSTRIDTLLDLAKGEMNMLELDYSQVDMLKLFNQVRDEMSPMASRQKLSLVTEFPSSLPLIWADESRLEQVISNLLTNAFKWSPDEGEVILRARENGDSLTIEVQDSGPGIAEDNQDKIFDAYYRVQSNTPRIGGLGLGLALCKTIVECHGGNIGVESEVGKGSTFIFSIPLRTDDK